MNSIFYRLIDLPGGVRGFTMEDPDGDFNIYINQNLSEDIIDQTVRHELQHIKDGDLDAEEYHVNDFGKANRR